ncbi:hypothetical protein [Streptomyces palmae]|uniref:Uncharacterized protein n=1 Tax=Streptomyces palmae TaxID=1701085 RepID=A0A4Z0H5Q4_9ACTN|nr:hypothetical protein [Streptomyces palmae]TGB07137.1 hypothetical protein E4099_17435 [Streptomyces palmae]
MAETTAARRTFPRGAAHPASTPTRRRRAGDADRKAAAAALQRALDRRDNGGAWGHLPQA